MRKFLAFSQFGVLNLSIARSAAVLATSWGRIPSTAAAQQGGGLSMATNIKDNVLVVLQSSGGNDAHTVITMLTGEAALSKWGKEKLDASPEMWQKRQKAQGLDCEKRFGGPMAVEVDDENRSRRRIGAHFWCGV